MSDPPLQRCSDEVLARSAKALKHCHDAQAQVESAVAQFHTSLVRFHKRDRHILRLLCQGKDAKEIADELEVAPGTAHTHIRNLGRKAGVSCDRQLVVYVMQQPHSLQPGAECKPGLHQVGSDSCPYCQAMSKAA